MGALILLLHVPLVMTNGVLRERQRYQAQAVQEISSVWGRQQRVTGPILAVPYTYRALASRTKVVNGVTATVEEMSLFSATAYFLPTELAVDGAIEPEVRSRGIYDAVVYTSRLKLSGALQADFAGAGIETEKIHWEKARLLFGVSDLHGVRAISPVRLPDGREAAFESAEATAGSSLHLAASVTGLSGTAPLAFSFDVVVQGSDTLAIAPVGKSTVLTLKSDWPDPSFTGSWLPDERKVDESGFNASWRIAHFSRGFPQAWTTRSTAPADVLATIDASAAGVRFIRGVDGYAMVERAHKYGILFFAITFAVFFLFEVTADLRIHPLQYAMVGAALCLFFLGFLALSEFWSIAWAYGAAAAACSLMVSIYAWTFLRTGRRTFVVLAGLGATYGCLYLVLRSQDYALLAGTAALFVTLALAMFFTRRIDWYALPQSKQVT